MSDPRCDSTVLQLAFLKQKDLTYYAVVPWHSRNGTI